MVTLRFRNDSKLILSGFHHYMVVEGEGVRLEIGVLGGGWKRCDPRMCKLLVPHRYHHWWMKHHFFSMQPISWAKSVDWCPPDTTESKLLWICIWIFRYFSDFQIFIDFQKFSTIPIDIVSISKLMIVSPHAFMNLFHQFFPRNFLKWFQDFRFPDAFVKN